DRCGGMKWVPSSAGATGFADSITASTAQPSGHGIPASDGVDVRPDRADVLAGGDLRQAAGTPEHAVDVGGRLGFHAPEGVGHAEDTIALLHRVAEIELEIDESAGGRAVLLEAGRARLLAV